MGSKSLAHAAGELQTQLLGIIDVRLLSPHSLNDIRARARILMEQYKAKLPKDDVIKRSARGPDEITEGYTTVNRRIAAAVAHFCEGNLNTVSLRERVLGDRSA